MAHKALLLTLTGCLALASSATAQETADTGEGANVVLTLVDTKPPFFRTGPSTITARHPDLYVRRASVAGESDQQLLIASVADGDVIGPQVAAIRTIDLLEDFDGSVSMWGDVVAQTRPLTASDAPSVGFILGLYGGRDLTLREESLDTAAAALQGIDGVFLVARMRGGADLLAMYSVDGADLSAAVETADAVQDAMGAVEIEVEIEGVATAMVNEGS